MTEIPAGQPVAAEKKPRGFLQFLGPGLITGASDDDPSGIATYSQAGAQFGVDLGWTLLVSWPLMCAIQEISARIGRVTGRGIAGNLKQHYPAALVYPLVLLLVFANTINLGADLGAMAASFQLVIGGGNSANGGPALAYVVGFATVIFLAEIFISHERYVSVLKWLTLVLLAYPATALVVQTPWASVFYHLVVPNISFKPDYLTVVVAILGTTISPYLFFWQAEEEVEDIKQEPGAKPLERAPHLAKQEFGRIRIDTAIGMALSNLVALFILITTAATLHAHHATDIQTSAQAALALKPIAGELAFLVFALGIVGCGLLAVPVLAASAAYAIGEVIGVHVGLTRRPRRAPIFYGMLTAAGVAGVLLNFIHVDPIKALFWSAVVNGLAAVPIMAMIMHLAGHRPAMGDFRLPPVLNAMGWISTAVMGAAAFGMFATIGSQ